MDPTFTRGNIAFIGIGSNVGDKISNCERAIAEITQHEGNRLIAQSSLYKTEPIGYTQQDWFINCAIEIETNLTAHELLHVLEGIELSMERKRSFKWGPRIIDLDILFFNQDTIQCEELMVPHPELEKRAFVLVPLCEIAGDYIHPVLKRSISQMVAQLKGEQGIEKL